MCKSRVLVNYRYIDKMSEADKYALDLKIQQAISKLMFGYVSQKQISDFSIGDNDYIEDLIANECHSIYPNLIDKHMESKESEPQESEQ